MAEVLPVGKQPKDVSPAKWRDYKEWRRQALARDRKSCQRCALGEPVGVHHIVPREEGGDDHPENLITLCIECHDAVEVLYEDGLPRSRAAIIGSLPADPHTPVGPQERPSWHALVYGSAHLG